MLTIGNSCFCRTLQANAALARAEADRDRHAGSLGAVRGELSALQGDARADEHAAARAGTLQRSLERERDSLKGEVDRLCDELDGRRRAAEDAGARAAARQHFAEHFFRSNARHCTATACILMPAECSAVS